MEKTDITKVAADTWRDSGRDRLPTSIDKLSWAVRTSPRDTRRHTHNPSHSTHPTPDKRLQGLAGYGLASGASGSSGVTGVCFWIGTPLAAGTPETAACEFQRGLYKSPVQRNSFTLSRALASVLQSGHIPVNSRWGLGSGGDLAGSLGGSLDSYRQPNRLAGHDKAE